jgi:hypothetical protein
MLGGPAARLTDPAAGLAHVMKTVRMGKIIGRSGGDLEPCRWGSCTIATATADFLRIQTFQVSGRTHLPEQLLLPASGTARNVIVAGASFSVPPATRSGRRSGSVLSACSFKARPLSWISVASGVAADNV